MAILISEKTKVLIQGITGKEGGRAADEMRIYGTEVLAGVVPGKGGLRVNGVRVYNTVGEALKRHPEINATLVVVSPRFVKEAALESIMAGIPLINILTENILVEDAAMLVAWARLKNVTLIGPSSVGIISPGKAKIGSIGSGSTRHVFTPGPIGIVSKSGGMTAEIAQTLSRAGWGQSTALGIGGDQIIGFDFVDALKLFTLDSQTKAVILFGEVGGTYEEQAADYIRNNNYKKPVIAIIAGKFTETLPAGTILGHAGTIVSRGRGSYASKVKAFNRAGANVAGSLDEAMKILKRLLTGKKQL